jgi:hypothetical protein
MFATVVLATALTTQLGPPPAYTPDYNPFMWGSPIMQYKMGLNPYTNGYDPILGFNPIYTRPTWSTNGYNGPAYFYSPEGRVSGGWVSGNQVYGGGPDTPHRVRYPNRHRYGNGY